MLKHNSCIKHAHLACPLFVRNFEFKFHFCRNHENPTSSTSSSSNKINRMPVQYLLYPITFILWWVGTCEIVAIEDG